MTTSVIESPLKKKKEGARTEPLRWFVKFWIKTRGESRMPLIAIVSKAQLEVIKKNVAIRGVVTVLKEVDPNLYQELLDIDFKIQQRG